MKVFVTCKCIIICLFHCVALFSLAEEHPLAEISMPLDAPSSMEPMTETAYLEMREDMFRTPRGKRNGNSIHRLLIQFTLPIS